MVGYELATSIHFRYDSSCRVPITHEIERMAFCGFKNLDFNFCDMCNNKNSDFLSDGWREWIADCRKTADYCNVKFVQAHAPCESVYDFNNYDFLVNACIRAMECCFVLGIPWMVYHPMGDPKYRFDSDDDVYEFNMKFFKELLPYAEKYSVGIAIETIVPFFCGMDPSEAINDHIRLIDDINSEYVGACIDVGHFNIYSMIDGAEQIANQSETIKKFGSRLKCTHIHDNSAKNRAACMKVKKENVKWTMSLLTDDHLPPYMGTIDWDDVISGLDDIGYNHYFTYEAHRAANTLPEEMVNKALIQLREVGESLVAKSKLC